jgi:hypothetical protein
MMDLHLGLTEFSRIMIFRGDVLIIKVNVKQELDLHDGESKVVMSAISQLNHDMNKRKIE